MHSGRVFPSFYVFATECTLHILLSFHELHPEDGFFGKPVLQKMSSLHSFTSLAFSTPSPLSGYGLYSPRLSNHSLKPGLILIARTPSRTGLPTQRYAEAYVKCPSMRHQPQNLEGNSDSRWRKPQPQSKKEPPAVIIGKPEIPLEGVDETADQKQSLGTGNTEETLHANSKVFECTENGSNNASSLSKGRNSCISLVKALVKLKVASEETCHFLIKNGCISVNGVVTDDPFSRIHCTDDHIIVDGCDVGTVDNASPPLIDEHDRKNIPKPHQSRSPQKVEEILQNHRSVDGGFYVRRRRRYGK